MGNENLAPPNIPSISEMLRVTGNNTAMFMEQVALHIEKLEAENAELKRKLGSETNDAK